MSDKVATALNSEYNSLFNMVRISGTTRLDRVQHIVGSGTGVLDFAVEGESEYYTWEESEDADWEIEDASRVENIEEDRFIMYPAGEYFTCEIEGGSEGVRDGSVRCWSESE